MDDSNSIKLLMEAYQDVYNTSEIVEDQLSGYEFLLAYLIHENFADNIESAQVIIENMSDEWIQSIFEQDLNEVAGMGRVILRSISNALSRGMRKAPITKLDNKLGQLNHEIKNVRNTGNVKDLESIEQRIKKLNTVKNARSMQRARQGVRDITNQYK